VLGQKGSDGVANYVQQNTNSITYVETGYALERNFPVVYVKNASGHYAFPSSQNDATALTHAQIQPDLISDLSGVHVAPEANAYPIAGYSYMITPTKTGFGFTTAKGAVLGKFILYMACAGQQKAASLGYSPLTPVLVKGVFAAVRRIPGAPAPPPLSKCANPTLHNGAPSGAPGPQGNGGGQTGNGGGNGKHHHSKGSKNTSGGGGNSTATSTSTSTSGYVAPGVVLTAQELAARRNAALNALSNANGSSSTPLILAIIDIALIALCPWIIWHRRRRVPSAGEPPTSGAT
jgi:hypothetical protein